MAEQAYNYTDLQVVLKIDPVYCTGTLKAAFTPSSGTSVEVDTTDYNPSTGEVLVSLTQAQSANLHGIVTLQLNGFYNSLRWASKQVFFRCDNNLIGRVLS